MIMASNLTSARALIEADLNHARYVMALWSDQVTELGKALEQIDAVGESRNVLRGEYQAQRGRASALTTGSGTTVKAKRGRKPKPEAVDSNAKVVKGKKPHAMRSTPKSPGSTAASPNEIATGRSGSAAKKRTLKTGAVAGVARYQDPDSGKTWTGHGRRPRWMTGTPENYLIEGRASQQIEGMAAGGESPSREAIPGAPA